MAAKRKNSVCFNMFGGIGNQLFIFYAGQYFEKISGKKVRYRFVKMSQKDSVHNSSILDLNLDIEVASRSIFHEFKTRFLFRIINLIDHKFFKPIRSNLEKKVPLYVSPVIGFDKNLSGAIRKEQFTGYFQTARYFAAVIENRDFLLEVRNPSKILVEELEKASLIQPVMLHVRRGDYLNNPQIGLLSTDYYRNAVRKLDEILGEKPIWVFCDDLEMSKSVLAFLPTHRLRFIDRNTFHSDTESLYLMSRGQAIIIANSSFSYWAAMINGEKKIVITPNKWFAGLEDPQELYPHDWIRIKNIYEIS
jgi:hypothetical protein